MTPSGSSAEPPRGSQDAQMNLAADLYKSGKYADALDVYSNLSRKGENVYATVQLAHMYATGLGTLRDIDVAERLYETAAQSGSLYAKYYFALFLLKSQREPEAREIMDELTNKGYLPAIYWLGKMFYEGIGGSRDRETGEYYLRYAAVSGGHIWADRYLISLDLRSRSIRRISLAVLRLPVVAFRAALIGLRASDDNRIRS
jgi:TPR repeat protein